MNDAANAKPIEVADNRLHTLAPTELTDAQLDQVAGGAAFKLGPFVVTPSGNVNLRGAGNLFRF
jgi:hypothetical protein